VAAEPMNNSINGCADSLFEPGLACFRWHDDGASVGVMIVGERSLSDTITSHSSIIGTAVFHSGWQRPACAIVQT
jgi:hypothetical protein